MTAGTLLAAVFILAAAGAFGACLPVVRELGRPTRLASALLSGAAAVGIASAAVETAGFPLSIATLFVPLVATSVVAARLLCRLPESPGPENAYPGFPAALVVFVPTVYLVGMLARGNGSAGNASAHGVRESLPALAQSLPSFTHASQGGLAPVVLVLWLLAALPLVAALLAIHVPLRRGWMIAAVWYAALAISLAHWQAGDDLDVLRVVFVTLGALAVFSCAKEPRLLPFALLMLCGAAITGSESLVAIAAIVAGAFVRDLEGDVPTAIRRAALLLACPALAVALGSGGTIARVASGGLASLTADFPGSLATGIFGFSWAVPLLVIVAVLPGNRHRIASLLPVLAPGTALAIALLLDRLQPGSGAATAAFLARSAMSMLILVAGLSLRDPSRHARPTARAAHAR